MRLAAADVADGFVEHAKQAGLLLFDGLADWCCRNGDVDVFLRARLQKEIILLNRSTRAHSTNYRVLIFDDWTLCNIEKLENGMEICTNGVAY